MMRPGALPRDFVPALETISSGESWPPTPTSRVANLCQSFRCGRCRIEKIVAAVLALSMITTFAGLALTSSGYVSEAAQQRVRSTLRRFGRRPLANATGVLSPAGPACSDNHSTCVAWARDNQCVENPSFMLEQCQRACGKCADDPAQDEPSIDPKCEDQSSFCGQWAAVGECSSNPNYMRHSCPVTCHLCQSRRCHDVAPRRCADEAGRGLCLREPERMYHECRWACKWCAMETSTRCKRPAGMRPAATAGSLDAMFRRAISPQHAHYSPVVHSRDPWVVSFTLTLTLTSSSPSP